MKSQHTNDKNSLKRLNCPARPSLNPISIHQFWFWSQTCHQAMTQNQKLELDTCVGIQELLHCETRWQGGHKKRNQNALKECSCCSFPLCSRNADWIQIGVKALGGNSAWAVSEKWRVMVRSSVFPQTEQREISVETQSERKLNQILCKNFTKRLLGDSANKTVTLSPRTRSHSYCHCFLYPCVQEQVLIFLLLLSSCAEWAAI